MLDNKDLEMIANLMKDTFSGITEVIHKSNIDLDKKFTDVQTGVDRKLTGLDKKFTDVQTGVDRKLTGLDKKFTGVQMTIENEIRRNIEIIAENHIGLNKKLDEVLSREEEKELMKIKINVLESEIRKLKEQIEKIA